MHRSSKVEPFTSTARPLLCLPSNPRTDHLHKISSMMDFCYEVNIFPQINNDKFQAIITFLDLTLFRRLFDLCASHALWV